MEHVLQRIREVHELVQRVGPYLLLEILLPGGTLFALALYMLRQREAQRRAGSSSGLVDPLLDRLLARFDDAFDLRVVAGHDGQDDGLEPLGLPAR